MRSIRNLKVVVGLVLSIALLIGLRAPSRVEAAESLAGKTVRSPVLKGDAPTFYEVYKDVHGKPPSGPLRKSWKVVSLEMAKLTRTLVLPPDTPGQSKSVASGH